MLYKKRFSDFEEMFVESIKDKTVGELMDAYCRLDSSFLEYHDKSSGSYFGNSYFIDERSIRQELEKKFFSFFFEQKEAREIPILGGTFIVEDYAVAVEKTSHREYKVIYYDCDGLRFVRKKLALCSLEPSPLKTIGDFEDAVNNYLYNIFG